MIEVDGEGLLRLAPCNEAAVEMNMLNVDRVGEEQRGRLTRRCIYRLAGGGRHQLVAGQARALVAAHQVRADLITGARHAALVGVHAERPCRLFARRAEALRPLPGQAAAVRTVGGRASSPAAPHGHVLAERSLVRAVLAVHLLITMQLDGQTLGQIFAGDVTDRTGAASPTASTAATGGRAQDRILVRRVLDGGGPAVLLAVAEPALHDAFGGAGAGELARRAGGRRAARRLVRPVQAVGRAVADPPSGDAFGPVGAGELVRAAV